MITWMENGVELTWKTASLDQKAALVEVLGSEIRQLRAKEFQGRFITPDSKISPGEIITSRGTECLVMAIKQQGIGLDLVLWCNIRSPSGESGEGFIKITRKDELNGIFYFLHK